MFLITELLPQSLSFYFLYFSKYHCHYIIMSLMEISENSIFAWGRVSMNCAGWSWIHCETNTSSERTIFLQWFHQEPWYQSWNVKPVFFTLFCFLLQSFHMQFKIMSNSLYYMKSRLHARKSIKAKPLPLASFFTAHINASNLW